MRDATTWASIFAFGLLGLNWPILDIFHEDAFAYLLGFWLLFVLLVGLAARGGKTPPAT